MSTLLLELFSEEIPSRMQRKAAEQLHAKIFTFGLFKFGLVDGKDSGDGKGAVKTYVSPRHLAIQVFGLPDFEPDTREEKRGPKIGAPEQAMKGFLQSSGLTVEQCEQRDGYYYATIERKGRATAEVVKEICEQALKDFSWPKSMHWGSRDKRPASWVRPLHRITCLLDDQIVPVQFAHLTASNQTQGHRFLSPAAITIAHAEQYEATIKKAYVVVDFDARRAQIKSEIAALASKNNLTIVEDDALLNEVTGLVEWPVPLLCKFDAKFLDLPREVLISEMKNHQRYFALNDAAGNLSTQFITVANMVNADGGKHVIAGNERVVRARLSDGEFYWDQDKKTKLEDWGKKLSDVVFHAKVGMMNEKVARIEVLALILAKAVGFADTNAVKRAAELCKADLTSGMVGEFPELQGIMGRYYALAQGETPAIADAIRDHYKPVGANDSTPETPLAAIIAMADKLDSIFALFMANEKPTGSKDPFALRRSVLGIFKILSDHNWSIDLREILIETLGVFVADITKRAKTKKTETLLKYADLFANGVAAEIKKMEENDLDELAQQVININRAMPSPILIDTTSFFRDRLKQIFRDEGIRADIIEATLQPDRKTFIPGALMAQAKALDAWLKTTAGTATLAAIKRTINILAAEEKKAKTTFAAKLPEGLKLAEEIALVAAAKQPVKTLGDLEKLEQPIQAFFEKVLVNEPEFRDARLGLLAAVREAAYTIADFSKIEG